MKETKGLVIKITDQFIVVMCDDGKFRNLPLPKKVPSVGERITVPLRKKKRIPYSWLYSAAACLFIFIGLTLFIQMQPKYDHVIAIDINPKMELYLDSESRVVKVKALNSDADQVLKQFPSGKVTLHNAIEQVLTRSIALGYMNNDKDNMIMIAIAKLKGESVINSSTIESVVTKILQSEHIHAFLKVEQADESLYDESKDKSVSLNTWLLIQQVERLGVHISVDRAASESLAQVLQKAGINKEQIFEPIRVSITQEKIGHQAADPTGEQKDHVENTNQQTIPTDTSVENESGTGIPSDVVINNTQQQKPIEAPSQDQRNNTNLMEPSGASESSKAHDRPGASSTSDISDTPKASDSSPTTGSSDTSSSSGFSGSYGSPGSSGAPSSSSSPGSSKASGSSGSSGSYDSSSSSGSSSGAPSSSSSSGSSKTSGSSGSSGSYDSSSSSGSSSSSDYSGSSSSSGSSAPSSSSGSSGSSDSSSSSGSSDSSSSSGSSDSSSSSGSSDSSSSSGSSSSSEDSGSSGSYDSSGSSGDSSSSEASTSSRGYSR
ncbi:MULTISPECIES: anti-sigma factor domain-containing protein [unclassified Paenibacillus]|uniref:anti-sigma factor domain-containing protein n=1 Tax=unclassified Paenibacillus TaxID=185978 RepID=UPI001AE25843|nr:MULTISPECIES: anti-sigma factor domain-containing protein [unclassified Paenibacillus]MBP1156790.1 hypothetical protein [Paenibacillus sp. PvP091]MBP1172471.1 hypothetical protein [Paenibacillus sp. PvR098]MBP2438852.1 hypothetical protein [Paenibacillus sp. PvP052]